MWQNGIPHLSTIHVAVQGDVNLVGERFDYNESLMFITMATVVISYVRDDDSVQEGVSREHYVRMHQ